MSKVVFWKIWTRATTEGKAVSVLNRVARLMGQKAQIIAVEPHPEINGHVVRFTVELESETWNDQIIAVLCFGQRVASGWSLTGSVMDDPGGWSQSVSDSAVEAIEWSFLGMER